MLRLPVPAFGVAVCLTAIVLSTPSAHAWLYREVRDWMVHCGNALTCTLETDIEGEEVIRGIAFERTVEPNAAVSLVVSIDAEAVKEPRSLTLDAEGESLSLDFAEAENMYEGWQWRFPASDEITAFLQAMKAEDTMEASLSGSDAKPVEISLAGVTAGLFFMDESQGRLDRRDALQAKGEKPVPENAPVSAINAIEGLPSSIRGEFETEEALCGGLDNERFSMLDAFRLDGGDGDDLIGAPCGIGGAYNQPYTLYAGSGDRFRALGFPIMGESGPSTMSMAYNVSYEPAKNRLTSFFKGRGLGDCGTYNVWRIGDDGMETVLTLIETRAKGDCDGDYAGGPDAWPLVWPDEEAE